MLVVLIRDFSLKLEEVLKSFLEDLQVEELLME